MKAAFASRIQGWAGRTGAKIDTAAEPADVRIVDAATVGRLAAEGKILPVPPELLAGDHACQWDMLLRVHRGRLASWGNTVMAIPVAVPGTILVVRKDIVTSIEPKYTAKFGRPVPLPPRTWEDLAEIGEMLKENGQALMPALTVTDFLRAAACYDRIAITETERIQSEKDSKGNKAMLSFVYDAESGEPRLTAPGFARAAALLQRLAPLQSTAPTDSKSPLETGACALAFLPLHAVAKLADSPAMREQLLFAPLPGTRSAYRIGTGTFVEFDKIPSGNYVPYFQAGAFAVVETGCANPAAAWGLVADLAGPARTLETFSEPALGSAPLRSEHLHQSGESVWQRYGFNPAASTSLGVAVKESLAMTTANAAYGPRGPDAAATLTAIENMITVLRTEPTAKAEVLLSELQSQLQKQTTPESRGWHRRAAGLN